MIAIPNMELPPWCGKCSLQDGEICYAINENDIGSGLSLFDLEDLRDFCIKRRDDCPLIEIADDVWENEKYKLIRMTEEQRVNKKLAEVVTCGECKHKPIKHDPEGDDFGFNLVSPNGYDNLCPCLNTDDGFYSYMPEDNFFCAYGERRTDEKDNM